MSHDMDKLNWFPLSAAQYSRWFLYQLDPRTRGNHNNVFAVSMRGAVDASAISRALDRLVARHEMLRARFRCLDGREPEQSIAAADHVPLAWVDVPDIDDVALRRQVSHDAIQPFDLTRASCIRASLYQRSERESVFLLVLDHLVCDGWSYWRLLEEFGALMSAVDPGASDSAGGVADYAGYVEWQRTWLQSANADKQFAYWEKTLGHEAPVLRLPADRPRPKVCSGVQGVVTLNLTAVRTQQLNELAARHACTVFTTLLGAYQILLQRFSGQSEIIVGTPVPGRSQADWDDVVGDFVNMLALRSDFQGDPSVADLLRSVRNAALKGMSNQDYPFASLVDRLRASHSADEHPFFQTVFIFQNARRSGALSELWNTTNGDQTVARWGSIELAGFALPQRVGSDRICLALQVIELREHLRFDFSYDADMFDAATVERLADSFKTLLDGMINNATQRVSTLPLLSAGERERVLQTYNATASEYPSARLVHEWFELQAKQRPQAIALVCAGCSLTYAELNAGANHVAHRLIALGVKPDDRVAICMQRGPAMVAGLLGILKAGGAYVPLDPTYPSERLAYMRVDCAPTALLTQESLCSLVDHAALPVLMLDDGVFSAPATANPDYRALGLGSRHLAYVIYTSGSTGLPKGVAIEHANTNNFIAWALANFSTEQLANTLFSTSINFDLAVYELFVPLAAGTCITLVKDVLAVDAICDAVSLINTVPSGINALLGIDGIPVSTHTINLAGEPLKRALVERIFATTDVQTVANLYGPSETTTYSTWVRMDRAQSFLPHIGRPVANTQVYIVDGHVQPVPTGVVGELYIGGAGVARGYLNRPELTAERFMADPFADDPEARMYRTGDLGRWLADGNIQYLGRNDFQVKIRGFRIELGEIEAKLAACIGVNEAVVVAREDRPGDNRLVAYVVAREGAQVSVAALRDSLSRELAEFMMPSAFVVLSALPLTPNGKLDRKALPAPDQAAVLNREYEAPQSDIERAIADIWQALLGLPRVGRHDHFFELGGHSLLALQVVSRIRLTLGVELALRDLFDRPTLAALAEKISLVSDFAAPPIALIDRSRPLPLSFAQQRLWFLDQLDPAAGAAYHMSAALQLRGVLQREALQAALDRIVARHESLRTTFVNIDGEPTQLIGSASTGFKLIQQDLRHLDRDRQAANVAELSAIEACALFDLATGPLIRGRLLRLAEDEHVLLVTQHHIISDGWSIGVLVKEVGTLYAAFSEGRSDPLPALAVQYADYAAWQRQRGVPQQQLDFWRAHLSGAPALLELPTDRPRPALQSYAGGTAPFRLSADLSAGLNALSRGHGTTLFMTLLAGWSILMSRLSGQRDLVIGSPVANRQRSEIEPLIGFFVNTLALRVALDSDPRVAELLAQIKNTTLDAYSHQDLPFEQVVELVQPARSLSHSPLFQVMLALNNTPLSGDGLQLSGLTLAALPQPRTTTQFDLSLSLFEVGGVISGEFEYASDLFDAATIQRWIGYLQTVLAGMVADANQRVSALALLTADDRREVVETFNATAVDYPAEQTMQALFEAQVERDPDAIAVVYEQESLSYAQVNRHANQLAHRLLELGVKPDDRVAICMARSVDLIVAVLGVLKSGAGYVPLDAGHPAERLAYLLADSAPMALLTQDLLRETEWVAAAEREGLRVLTMAGDARYPEHNPVVPGVTSRHLAYLIYTSGSTGQPKGVMVEHRSVVNLWQAFERDVFAQHGLGTRIGLDAELSFDASVQSLVQMLSGRCLVIVPAAIRADGAALLAFIERNRIEIYDCTPAQFELLIGQRVLDPDKSWPRTILIGGEALPTRMWQAAAASRLRCFNVYGPTECTVDASFALITPGSYPHIGRPLANSRIYVLGHDAQPLPIGVLGEIHIGGACLARGYFNRPELTAERFVADPFVREPDARMYKTGDLGRWLPDGNIQFQGRNDHQVKIRGFRIELGEIQTKLSACAGVREAVVIARVDRDGDKRLVAYVVAQHGFELEVAELRASLSRTLADYMIPGTFVTLSALPLTSNGKLDREALPAPDQSSVLGREYAAPLGEIERAVAEIWEVLLGVARVGRHDHFFEMGGNSLVITRLSFAMQEKFGVSVSVAELYRRQILTEMAEHVAQQVHRQQQGAHSDTAVVLEI